MASLIFCWHHSVSKFTVNGHKITETLVTRKVQGDGNCLFRALAYLISGDEEDHLMVRAVITEAIAKAGPGSVIQQFIGREPVWKYILRTNMPPSSVWGTKVEIFTAAQILQMDIFTPTHLGNALHPTRTNSPGVDSPMCLLQWWRNKKPHRRPLQRSRRNQWTSANHTSSPRTSLHRAHFIWTTAPGATMHQWLDSDERDELVYFFICFYLFTLHKLMKASLL